MQSTKDYKTVEDFNKKRQMEIFRGQCFNNACTLMAGMCIESISIGHTYDLARQLYDEGIKSNWLEYGNSKLPVEMTEEEGRKMDPGYDEEVVI